MRRFRYGRDALCIAACVAYAMNSWILPDSWRTPFLHEHLNDALLIPAALPLLLWAHRGLGLRAHDEPPRWVEIVITVVLWSVAAELVAPALFANATGDWRDIVAYAAGAAIAGLWWRR